MWFFYDSTGTRIGLVSGNTVYYYIYNLQGDVIALARASTGKIVAKYAYDAWGSCTVTNASGYTVGTKNPFRYRGYYYDDETGLYYLNSRYYSPEFGRFISADRYATTDVYNIVAGNGFVYCYNNPVAFYDNTGKIPLPNYSVSMTDTGSRDIKYEVKCRMREMEDRGTSVNSFASRRREVVEPEISNSCITAGIEVSACYSKLDIGKIGEDRLLLESDFLAADLYIYSKEQEMAVSAGVYLAKLKTTIKSPSGEYVSVMFTYGIGFAGIYGLSGIEQGKSSGFGFQFAIGIDQEP